MEVESVLVTGANRGIGLELVKQLVNLPTPPKFLFATYRNSGTIQELEEISDSSKECQISLLKLDITVPSEVDHVRQVVEDIVGNKGLNLLINNAAVLKMESFRDITDENMLFHFKTNTLGPLAVLKAMFPLLQRAASGGVSGMGVHKATALNISSMGGSILDVMEHDVYLDALGYRVSKAALNMAMRVVAADIRNEGVLVVQMCPGWVKTDMGTDAALITTEESVSAILNTLPTLNDAHHGAFIDRHGETIHF